LAIDEAFNTIVDYYDDWVRKAIPCYDELFEVAVECIPFPRSQGLKILDLGAGTGLYSWHVLQKYKDSTFVLTDVAGKMLDISKARFAEFQNQFSFIIGDYRESLPDGEFDLVISSLSIHHLDNLEKQRLFGRIFTKLRRGGVFINVDQIMAPSEHFKELYWSTWLRKVRQAGADEDLIQKSIQRRTEFDKDSTLQEQVDWLKDAGFEKVDCIYRHYFVGVFFAGK
jgi:tRNA (cmo5U34)-methyltransferase